MAMVKQQLRELKWQPPKQVQSHVEVIDNLNPTHIIINNNPREAWTNH